MSFGERGCFTCVSDFRESQSDRRQTTADGSWMVWTASGIGGIWVAVALISLLAPDMVSGSEQEHLPVAAFTAWLWGLVATGVFVWSMSKLRGDARRRPIWIGVAAATLVVWLVATILGIALPVFETGTDPTRVPIGAIAMPIVATVLTALAGITGAVFFIPAEADVATYHPANAGGEVREVD
jgi:hypothetical protein